MSDHKFVLLLSSLLISSVVKAEDPNAADKSIDNKTEAACEQCNVGRLPIQLHANTNPKTQKIREALQLGQSSKGREKTPLVK